MTRPTAGPEPVNCNTNQSKTMMVNWSPRYKMLSPSQSRWNAGWRNGAITFYFYVLSLEYPQALSSSI
jgi:hypothetical protein